MKFEVLMELRFPVNTTVHSNIRGLSSANSVCSKRSKVTKVTEVTENMGLRINR